MKADLKGKTAFVTGSSQGIGKAIALKLAENGADVALNARSPEAASVVQKMITGMGRRCLFERGDIAIYDNMKRGVDDILAQWGNLDILVTSGGASPQPPRLFHETSPELYLEYFRMVLSRLYPIRAVLDHMRERERGKIIIITTDAGRVPTPGESLIGAAAAALVMMTKVLAQEFSRWKIHINTICLTVTIDTPAYERAIAGGMGKIFERAAQRMPFWPLTAKDAAELALFLASEDSDRITGQVFSINGGLSFPG